MAVIAKTTNNLLRCFAWFFFPFDFDLWKEAVWSSAVALLAAAWWEQQHPADRPTAIPAINQNCIVAASNAEAYS